VDFILANAIVFYMHWAIKKNLVVFNLVDFCNSPNRQNKFYTKFSSYTVYYILLFTKYTYIPVVIAVSGCSSHIQHSMTQELLPMN